MKRRSARPVALYIWNAGRSVSVPFGDLPDNIHYEDNWRPHDRTSEFPYRFDPHGNPPRDFDNTWNGLSFSPVWTGIMFGTN